MLVSLMILGGMGLSVANAQEAEMTESTETEEVYRLADTPTRYGFKGLYSLFSPETYQKGKFGIGVFGEMTRFCLPGDPRYPELMEFILAGAYGITDRLEVGVAAPFRSLKLPAASTYEVNGVIGRRSDDPGVDEISESGFSNVSLGLRYQLLSDKTEDDEDRTFNVTPYILAFLPTAQDPENGLGADNTRIHFGVSAGTVGEGVRFYSQVAYQFATDYDQDRQDFTERGWWVSALNPPRFDYFGTNPLFHEYGNTLFYGAGLAVPILPDTVEIFGEFMGYHSFEDEDYIPMFEDYDEPNNFEPLDVVQDGGLARIGAQIGFGNGLALKAGWGTKVFAEEPMYESPIWQAFAGLTYNSPREETVTVELVKPPEEKKYDTGKAKGPREIEPIEAGINCDDILSMMVHFEFDKSTLTPEGIATLKKVGMLLRLCKDYRIEVQGHTDWMGTENYNMGLGNRRARAVVYYLVYDEGIAPERVVLKTKMDKTPPVIAGETYGETQPIASNETDAGRAQNRRAQFAKR
jgi:outer membrane protein OmpA-like peptidoglycan-associated protein